MSKIIRHQFDLETKPTGADHDTPKILDETLLSHTFDPDSLDDVPRPKLKGRGWTLGNSGSLIEGAEDESPWVAIGWVVIPTGLAALILFAMLHG